MSRPSVNLTLVNSPATPARLHSIAPIFSTTDLARWADHYRQLGFTVETYGDVYGFAWTDKVELHVSLNPDHDPATTAGCAYLTVDDPDAVHREWSSPSHQGRDIPPRDTAHGIREGAHIDPDNNMLRFGAPITDSGPTA